MKKINKWKGEKEQIFKQKHWKNQQETNTGKAKEEKEWINNEREIKWIMKKEGKNKEERIVTNIKKVKKGKEQEIKQWKWEREIR